MEKDKNIVDNIMGIIIKNSEGIVTNLNDGSAGYVSSVYLNTIKEELKELLKTN